MNPLPLEGLLCEMAACQCGARAPNQEDRSVRRRGKSEESGLWGSGAWSYLRLATAFILLQCTYLLIPSLFWADTNTYPQTSTLDSFITRLLVVTKQLLQGLDQWSQGVLSEEDVSAHQARQRARTKPSRSAISTFALATALSSVWQRSGGWGYLQRERSIFRSC